jgi:hypothetical protein
VVYQLPLQKVAAAEGSVACIDTRIAVLVAVVVMLIVYVQIQNGRLIVNTEGSWSVHLCGSFRVVYQLPPQKVAAAERVGGLCRYSNSCACSSGNVDCLRANPGERAIDRQHGRLLVRTSLVDPFRVVYQLFLQKLSI